jgi:hypothetical protein
MDRAHCRLQIAPTPRAVEGLPAGAQPNHKRIRLARPRACSGIPAKRMQADAVLQVAAWRSAWSAGMNWNRHYPEAARARGEQGTVRLALTIGRGGQVMSARLVGKFRIIHARPCRARNGAERQRAAVAAGDGIKRQSHRAGEVQHKIAKRCPAMFSLTLKKPPESLLFGQNER